MSLITNTYEFSENKSAHKKLVILLHGLGSNGQDLISLARYFAKAVPDAMFVSPDAPFPCDMVPEGYPNSFQWFSLQSRDQQDMLNGVKSAFPVLKSFIAAQIEKYDVQPKDCALIGFSQGTMMSLYTAPRYGERLAGTLGYSGALLWEPDTDVQTLSKCPVRLIHGEADDVVPVEAYHDARASLERSGFDVSGHTTKGLPHSIDEEGIESGMDFLRSILA